MAIISAGESNPYGHPSATVLDRLDETLLLRTDEHGTIRLSTDGDKLWVETGRERATLMKAMVDTWFCRIDYISHRYVLYRIWKRRSYVA